MVAYLIGEDGPHAGTTVAFEEGEEWILGRDPDVSYFVLEDPMVSRRHALLRYSDGLYFIENLSAVNPIQVNGEIITDSHQLREDDTIQIGNSFFRFTEYLAPQEQLEPSLPQDELSRLPFVQEEGGRWMLKVISGPNQGAEFGMNVGETHILGKDPTVSDIVFQDLSVSREHAKITLSSDGTITIEDLNSRNGVLVNGSPIDREAPLKSQDLISLGTTSFLLIDRERSRETIYSPPPAPPLEKEILQEGFGEEIPEGEETVGTVKNWKEILIPTRHLAIVSVFAVVLFIGVVSFFALFRTSEVTVVKVDENKEIERVLQSFSGVQFSHNPNSGKIFLTGHVLTDIDHSELLYLLQSLSFVTSVEDNVIVDEGVWIQMNELLSKNPNWRSVKVTSSKPGRFVVRGYLSTEDESGNLKTYLNLYFPYLNLLDNEVVVENTLNARIQNLLIEKGYANVTFQFSDGELIFAGRVNSDEEEKFNDFLDDVRRIQGIRQVRNFIIFTTLSTSKIDLSANYKVTGNSRFGDVSQYVLINGKILSVGDTLDGMKITGITQNEVDLDKEGIKYKIDYNLQ